jgi:predicted class III extradiol MEMO1 family dioxygenase
LPRYTFICSSVFDHACIIHGAEVEERSGPGEVGARGGEVDNADKENMSELSALSEEGVYKNREENESTVGRMSMVGR